MDHRAVLVDRQPAERLRRGEDVQRARDDGGDVPHLRARAHADGAALRAARGDRLRSRPVLHLLRDGDAGAGRVRDGRDRLLRHSAGARGADAMERHGGSRDRSRRPLRPRRADRRAGDHGLLDRHPVRLLRWRSRLPRPCVDRPPGGARSGRCRRVRAGARGGAQRRCRGRRRVPLAGHDARPDALGLGGDHRRARRAAGRDRACDGDPRGPARADAVARRLHVAARGLDRAPHRLRRGQGRISGCRVRVARGGAEPRLHQSPAVRRAHALRLDPGDTDLGARGGGGPDGLGDLGTAR